MDLYVDTSISEEHILPIFRAEDGSVPNKNSVSNRSARFRVTAVAQQLFRVTVSTFQFKRVAFLIKP